jgi:hypothetical protein
MYESVAPADRENTAALQSALNVPPVGLSASVSFVTRTVPTATVGGGGRDAGKPSNSSADIVFGGVPPCNPVGRVGVVSGTARVVMRWFVWLLAVCACTTVRTAACRLT